MKYLLSGAAAATVVASAAFAGGVEKSAFSSRILFEEGSYGELSFSLVSPSVSGTVAGGALSSGDIFPTEVRWSLGYKQDLTETLSLAVILDQPIGANTDYPLGTGYPLQGSTAVINNIGLTALAKYTLPNNVSFYGGVRGLQTSGDVSLTGGYVLDTSSELDFGYIVGAAWEKPEIAARVALTYLSSITHTFTATENGNPSLDFSTVVPQSLLLEAQTGIAEDTLLFGSVRWVDWSVFDVTPAGFAAANGGASLVNFENDTITYNLGVGRRFNEQWSGALTLGYEPANGGQSGNLGPTDGNYSIGVGATYSPNERMDITAGISYVAVGSTFTQVPVAGQSDFSGNSAIAAGIRIGMKL
ncbi:MAG: outer membrane protein transport protein [Pseudomonadota bacterium]